MQIAFTQAYASHMDQIDSLACMRGQFHFPISPATGQMALYFTGNSLGLQPIKARQYLIQELDDWAQLGVEGHFNAKNPWFGYHHPFANAAARIVGAKPHEVVLMNGLTANLHFLMVSFYRPDKQRYRILIEGGAFPSDRYAAASQARCWGLEPKEAIVELQPRPGEHCLRTDDIIQTIHELGDTLALVLLPGVQYYTGQAFDIGTITHHAHQVGAKAGWDLAHAVGNIPLDLHLHDVDFAAWCTYKYLNSGPGAVAGAFVHERYSSNPELPRLEGWWGHSETDRFMMGHDFVPMQGAQAWQLSNAPVFNMAAHRAALELFDHVGMDALRSKSLKLTGFLEYILQEINRTLPMPAFEIISPSLPQERGCQLSIRCVGQGKAFFDRLSALGVIADWRNPDVVRVAPAPMYNSFTDVYKLGLAVQNALQSLHVQEHTTK
ncbi:MAG: kynureninase [Bacteroidetes bacterium]|jgi:kynureninase|nr:kynureninase [Bacteroidota bacterium]